MDVLTVAAAQVACVPGDVPANLATHARAIADARAQGVDLLVFPELSLTDYLSVPDLPRLARGTDAPELQHLAGLAGPMAVAVGFIERDADGRCFNSQALLADGRLLAVHRKANLPTYGFLQEGLHYAAGDRLGAVKVGGWRTATLICADAWNPALPWLAALDGAELLLVPVASARGAVGEGFDNPTGWDVTLRHMALTYGLPTVMANHAGCRGSLDFWGGSRVLDPSGRVLAQLGDGPGLAVAQVSKAAGEAARRRLPTVRDANPGLVRRELGRLIGEKWPAQDRSRRSPGD